MHVVEFEPGVAEIGHPGDVEALVEIPCDEVHGVRGPGGDDGVDGVCLEPAGQVAGGGGDPATAGVGDEELGAGLKG